MVPGGPRPRRSSAGHTLGRRAGRVSPCRLDIKAERFFEKLVFGTLFECPGILDIVSRTRTGAPAELRRFCTVGRGDWQACMGGPRNMQNDLQLVA